MSSRRILLAVFVIFCLTQHASSQKNSENPIRPKIVNGQEAVLAEYPYFGVLLINFKQEINKPPVSASGCGASLIHVQFVLTAAHCVPEPSKVENISVTFGEINMNEEAEPSPSRVTMMAKQWCINKYYNATDFENDIAMIQLRDRVTTNQYIQVIPVPYCYSPETFINRDGSIIGYGSLGADNGGPSDKLLKATLKVINYDECAKDYGDVKENVICAIGKPAPNRQSVCSGDSGGPLVVILDNPRDQRDPIKVQIGVVSYSGSVNKNCDVNKASVFTYVPDFRAWINWRIVKATKYKDPNDKRSIWKAKE